MDLVDVLKSIGHGIKVVAKHIAAGFLALVGSEAARDFAQASLEVLRSALGQIALTVVTQLEKQAIAGITKREIAFNEILAKAKEQGIAVSNHEVNLFLELAVTALRQMFVPEAD